MSDAKNFHCLVSILINVGTEVLRKLLLKHVNKTSPTFDAYIKQPYQRQKLNQLENKQVLEQRQMDVLIPPSGDPADIMKFDITLLVCLLTNIFCPAISQPEKRALLELRNLRNTFYGHIAKPAIPTLVFETQRKQLTKVLLDLAKMCGDAAFEDRIRNKILIEVASPTFDLVYVELLVEWRMKDDKQNELLQRVLQVVRRLEVAFWAIFVALVAVVAAAIFKSSPWSDLVSRGNIDTSYWSNSTINGCMNDDYSFPWNDFPRGVYLDHVQNFRPLVGREWLYEELISSLNSLSPSQRGVILLAHMGYGKSALVAHLVCATSESKAYVLRQNLLAYHICKFDELYTKDPVKFVRRLIGSLAQYIPEYRQFISTNEFIKLNMTENYCRKDLHLCFRYGITDPLRKVIKRDMGTFFIVIDALDECVENQDSNPTILEILQKARKFPSWIKFIATSRETPILWRTLSSFKKMQIIGENRAQSLHDARSYVMQELESRFEFVSEEESAAIANIMIEKYGSNFLLIKYAFDSMSGFSKSRLENMPETFDEVMENNFVRVFGLRGEKFGLARTVFELLVASRSVLSRNRLFEIFHIGNTTVDKFQFDSILHDCSYFLSERSGNILFNHKSVYNWLQNESRTTSPFRVSKKAGLELIAKHAMISLKKNKKVVDIRDVVNIAHKVEASKSQQLRDEFIACRAKFSLVLKATRYDNYRPIPLTVNDSDVNLIALLATTHTANDGDIFSMMLDFFGHITNEYCNLAALSASEQGKLDILLILLKRCATLSFRVPEDDVFYKANKLFSNQNKGHLEFAIQQERFNIVNLIRCHNITVFKESIMMNTSALFIVCKEGYDGILDTFLNATNITARSTQTCLRLSAYHGRLNCVKTLFSYGVVDKCFSTKDLRATSGVLPSSALIGALENGHLDIVSYLVNTDGHDLNCTDGYGNSALRIAVARNKTDIAVMLFNHGKISPGCQKRKLKLSCTETQVRYGYDVECSCSCNSSVYHLIADKGNIRLAEFVMNETWTWLVDDCDGVKPIHSAVAMGRSNLIDYILTRTPEFGRIVFTSKTREGLNALQVATILHQQYIFHLIYKMLKESSLIPIHSLDRNDLSLMHLAVLRRNLPIDETFPLVQFLLESSKEILWMRDRFGRNCLHYAIAHGHPRIVEYILKYYSSDARYLLIQQENSGLTPVQMALYYSHSNFEKNFSFSDFTTIQNDVQLGVLIAVNSGIMQFGFSTFFKEDFCKVVYSTNLLLISFWLRKFHYDYSFSVKTGVLTTKYYTNCTNECSCPKLRLLLVDIFPQCSRVRLKDDIDEIDFWYMTALTTPFRNEYFDRVYGDSHIIITHPVDHVQMKFSIQWSVPIDNKYIND